MASAAPYAIAAGASILGSIIGGNQQKAAAQQAAEAQENLLKQNLQYQQNSQQDSRNAIMSMAPYSHGASQAAAALHQPGAISYLQPGQGAVFGGQQVNATPTGGFGQAGNGVDYTALLANQQPGHTQMAGPSGGSLGSAQVAPPMIAQGPMQQGNMPQGQLQSNGLADALKSLGAQYNPAQYPGAFQGGGIRRQLQGGY